VAQLLEMASSQVAHFASAVARESLAEAEPGVQNRLCSELAPIVAFGRRGRWRDFLARAGSLRAYQFLRLKWLANNSSAFYCDGFVRDGLVHNSRH